MDFYFLQSVQLNFTIGRIFIYIFLGLLIAKYIDRVNMHEA